MTSISSAPTLTVISIVSRGAVRCIGAATLTTATYPVPTSMTEPSLPVAQGLNLKACVLPVRDQEIAGIITENSINLRRGHMAVPSAASEQRTHRMLTFSGFGTHACLAGVAIAIVLPMRLALSTHY